MRPGETEAFESPHGPRRGAVRVAVAVLLLLMAGAATEATAAADADAGGAPAARARDAGAPAAGEPHVADGGTSPSPAAAAAGGTGDGAAASTPDDGGTVGVGSGLFEQSLSAGAAETKTASTSAAGGTAPRFDLDGYARGDVYVGKVPGSSQPMMKAGYGELSLAVKTAKEPYGDAFAEARLRYGLQGDQQQLFVDLREAYVNAYVGPVDLRLGQQIVVWGRADAFNPTNNLTPFDIRVRSPIEDDRRLGNVGARMFVRLAPVRLEGVWMPLYVPSELPPAVLPQYVAYGPTRFPQPELDNGLEAARVHLELPAVEMSVSYLYGYAPLPGLTLSSITLDPVQPSVLVSRTAYNHHVIGFDFSTAIGDVLAVRGEAAFRRPIDYQNRIYAPRPDLQYVLGVDHTFGSVSVIAQYMGRYVFDWQQQNGPDRPVNPSDLMVQPPDPVVEQGAQYEINLQLAKTNQMLFSQLARVQHLATMRVEWLTAHDTLSVSALAMVNFTTGEWLAAPKVGYRMSDAMTAYVGAEIFAGPDGTLFGLVEEELSAGYAELRYTF